MIIKYIFSRLCYVILLPWWILCAIFYIIFSFIFEPVINDYKIFKKQQESYDEIKRDFMKVQL